MTIYKKFFENTPLAAQIAGGPDANIGALIASLLPNILIGAGVIFFFLILGGGFMMITSAGKESSPQDKAKASAAITYGVIGFLLVISAYFILQIVGKIIGVDFLKNWSL